MHHSPRHWRLAALAASVLFASSAHAALITFDTTQSPFTPGVKNQGWWSDTRPNTDANENYFIGLETIQTDGLSRNFFTFDLSSLDLVGSVVTSAVLELTRFGYVTASPSETIEFFDVSTAAATLNHNVGTSAAIFEDLGTGVSYGSFVVPSYSSSNVLTLTFSLNQAALAAITSATGNFFSIGGTLQTIDELREGLFGGSGFSPSIQRLTLDIQPVAVSEPGTLLLFAASGVLALIGARRRRDRSRSH
jgi:hypothetical protein